MNKCHNCFYGDSCSFDGVCEYADILDDDQYIYDLIEENRDEYADAWFAYLKEFYN